MRVLAITKIFPNAAEPLSAPFNRQQFAALRDLCELEVWATIPWFPGATAVKRLLGREAAGAIPAREHIDGLPVVHPRTPYLPRIGTTLAAPLYAAALAPAAIRSRGRFDVILGSWAYPDGAAAVALADLMGAPAVVKLHGSDINVIANMHGPRVQIARALRRASGVVSVSRALARTVESFGVARDRIHLVMNGIDSDLFRVRPRADARRRLGLDPERRWILYVGHLKPIKGTEDVIAAFSRAAKLRPELSLAIVGAGDARAACERAAAPLGDRVLFAGPRPFEEIPQWMAACDVLCLPSWFEGTPNVILEAFGCGRRVVATAVGGVPDLVTSETLGELVPPRDPEALGRALARAAITEYDPDLVARLGSPGDWGESARALHDVLSRAAGRGPKARAGAA